MAFRCHCPGDVGLLDLLLDATSGGPQLRWRQLWVSLGFLDDSAMDVADLEIAASDVQVLHPSRNHRRQLDGEHFFGQLSVDESMGPSLDLPVVELSGVDPAVKTNRIPNAHRSARQRMGVPSDVRRKRP